MDRRNAIKNTAALMGITLSGATITALFQSCQQQEQLDWQPKFFTSEQAAAVSALTEIILPRTDTPGTLDLKVNIFVDLMCQEVLSPEDQEHVRRGCEEFLKTTQDMFGKAFPDLSTEEQVQVVKRMASESNKFNPSIWGSTLGEEPPIDFFRRMKQFTLLGYYTSEQIGKEVLVYDPIPGAYKGCIPLEDVGNAWAL